MNDLALRTLDLVARGAPLAQVLDTLVRGHEELFPGTLGSVLLLDQAGAHVHPAAAPSLPAEYSAALNGAAIGPQEGSCGTAAYTGQEVIVTDIATDHRWATYRALAIPHGLRACWSVPFRAADGRVLGTFALYYRTPRAPEPAELDAIRVSANLAGIATDHERRDRERRTLMAAEHDARIAADRAHREVLDILEGIADGFIALDRDGRCRYVSKAAAVMLRRDARSLIGRPLWQEFADAVGGPFHRAWERAMTEMRSTRVEDVYPPLQRRFEMTTHVSPDGSSIFFRDVTDLRLSAEAHRVDQERLKLVVKGTGTGLWDWDLSTNEVYYSPEWKALLGFAGDEVQQELSEWARLTHPDDARTVLAYAEAYIANPVGMFDAEFRMRHKDGSWRWIHSRGVVLPGEAGSADRLVGTHHDVTERKHAEEQLRSTLNLLERAEELGGVGTFVHDLDSAEIWRSNAALGIIGVAPGTPAPSVAISQTRVHPDDAHVLGALAALAEGDGATRQRFRYQRPDGQWRTLEIRAEVERVGGRRRFIGALADVTAEVERETELRELAASIERAREAERSRVAREIHDELGQAVTTLKMDLAWLRDRLPPEPALVERAGAAMALLDETALMARRIAANLRPGVLDDLGLESAVRWQGREFGRRSGLAVEVEVVGGEPDLAEEAQTAAFRVLQEALTNVIRHARACTVWVRISSGDDGVVLEIEDDGIGLQPRGPDAPRTFGIVGMRERALSCGGRLRVRKGAQGGTTVRLTLPRGATVQAG